MQSLIFIFILFCSLIKVNFCVYQFDLNSIYIDNNGELTRTEYVLSKNIIPLHYDLYFSMDGMNSYNGSVDIQVKILKSTDLIEINSLYIKIHKDKSFIYDGERKMEFARITVNTESRSISLRFLSPLKIGFYKLHLEFEKTLYATMKGIYLIWANNKEDFITSTHMEPAQARDAFPCFDEPNLKATFKLTLNYSKNFHAVSNTPIETDYLAEDRRITTFEKTPKMSTYLLAFTISNFVYVENLEGRIPIRIYIQPEITSNAVEFALNMTLKCFNHLERHLGVNYSISKLDSIIIPNYPGGMENWGLINYGYGILIDPNSNTSKSRIASVEKLICHEVAHQWFGNLVTLDWWDYVWLNEGFAIYYAMKISDMITPGKRFMEKNIANLFHLKRDDSLIDYSEALNKPVRRPMEYFSKFNDFGYYKGSAIIFFMSLVFPNFEKAITRYLKDRSFKSALPADLFASINEETYGLPQNVNVSIIMENWISYPGYPLLTVEILNSADNSNSYNNISITKVKIAQERFILNENRTTNDNSKWWIPIIPVFEENPQFEEIIPPYEWLNDTEQSGVFNFQKFDGWMILNPQQAVYCRVNYDIKNWRKIFEYLKGPNFTKIHVLNRVQLVSDVFVLVKVKKLPKNIILHALGYLEQETDKLVLNAIKPVLNSYEDEFDDDVEVKVKLKALYTTFYGMEDEALLISDHSRSEDIDVLSELNEKYHYLHVLNEAFKFVDVKDEIVPVAPKIPFGQKKFFLRSD